MSDGLDDDSLGALRNMHAKLSQTKLPWFDRLDGTYIPIDVLRVWNTKHEVPFIEGESFTVTSHGSAIVQRHIIHKHGVAICGPKPAELIERVRPSELQQSVSDMLERYWWPLIEDPDWLRERRKQPFAVLTICRSLYTVEHAEVVSKRVAAAWAKQRLGTKWSQLISAALERDVRCDRLGQIVAFIGAARDTTNEAAG